MVFLVFACVSAKTKCAICAVALFSHGIQRLAKPRLLRLAGSSFKLLLRFNRNIMRKSELLIIAKQKLTIRNYSKRTIESYLSAVNHFSNWLIQEKITTISERVVEKYLYELKENKNRSISAMKQSIAAIKFIFSDVLKRKIPNCLNIHFRKEEKIPVLKNMQLSIPFAIVLPLIYWKMEQIYVTFKNCWVTRD